MSTARRSTPPPQIGALLRLAWEDMQAEMQRGLHDAGFEDLRPAHRSLLRYPPIDGLRPTKLADRDGLSKQANNDLLRELERLGYLTLEADPDDRRARIIRFTERAWALYDTAVELSRSIGRRWAAAVGEDRYAEFDAVLREIVETQLHR